MYTLLNQVIIIQVARKHRGPLYQAAKLANARTEDQTDFLIYDYINLK